MIGYLTSISQRPLYTKPFLDSICFVASCIIAETFDMVSDAFVTLPMDRALSWICRLRRRRGLVW